MENILIVEDSRDVNELLSQVIRSAGYNAESAYTGIDGINEIKKDKYDLIILDIMLPYKSGDEILKEVRQFSDVPVIIISAKDMVGTKVDMLKLGADDYITKPFDIDEVIARVETNLRRYKKSIKAEDKITYKDIIIDCSSKTVEVNGKAVSMTVKEYDILELLMKNIGRVFSKAVLYESIWGSEYLGDDKTVKTHMSNLRNKLNEAHENESYIETVWGIGYRLGRK